MAVERVPAVICDIKQLKEGSYVEMPGWEPNYVIIDKKVKASRVNVIGVITLAEIEGASAQYTLTDGTSEIALRSYDRSQLEASPGEPVLVVARPRIYQNEIYLATELIKRVDQRWAAHRKKHLEILEKQRAHLEEVEVPPEEERAGHEEKRSEAVPKPNAGSEESQSEEPASDTERIYAMIENLDPGDGAELTDVLTKAQAEGIEDAEKAVHHMLEMGDVFEIRAGRLKVL